MRRALVYWLAWMAPLFVLPYVWDYATQPYMVQSLWWGLIIGSGATVLAIKASSHKDANALESQQSE